MYNKLDGIKKIGSVAKESSYRLTERDSKKIESEIITICSERFEVIKKYNKTYVEPTEADRVERVRLRSLMASKQLNVERRCDILNERGWVFKGELKERLLNQRLYSEVDVKISSNNGGIYKRLHEDDGMVPRHGYAVIYKSETKPATKNHEEEGLPLKIEGWTELKVPEEQMKEIIEINKPARTAIMLEKYGKIDSVVTTSKKKIYVDKDIFKDKIIAFTLEGMPVAEFERRTELAKWVLEQTKKDGKEIKAGEKEIVAWILRTAKRQSGLIKIKPGDSKTAYGFQWRLASFFDKK